MLFRKMDRLIEFGDDVFPGYGTVDILLLKGETLAHGHASSCAELIFSSSPNPGDTHLVAPLLNPQTPWYLQM